MVEKLSYSTDGQSTRLSVGDVPPGSPVVPITFGGPDGRLEEIVSITGWTEPAPWWMFWRRTRSRTIVH